jgi:hypothetical protein
MPLFVFVSVLPSPQLPKTFLQVPYVLSIYRALYFK